MSRLILVVGVGRSGTSLLSGMLGQLGFHIPQPEVKADETNPRGFGEPRWVVDFHTRLLRERRVTVNDARPGGVGDHRRDGRRRRGPRRAERLAGRAARARRTRSWSRTRGPSGSSLWTRSAAEHGIATSFVTMLRHPAEIVASARKSYGPGLTTAGRSAAWLNVMLQTEHATRGAPRAFVRYEDLLADWVPEIRRIGTLLGVPALARPRPRHPSGGRRVRRPVAAPQPRRLGRARRAGARARAGRRRLGPGPGARAAGRRHGGGGAGARRGAGGVRRALRGGRGDRAVVGDGGADPARRRRARGGRAASLRVRIARRVPARYRRRLRSALAPPLVGWPPCRRSASSCRSTTSRSSSSRAWTRSSRRRSTTSRSCWSTTARPTAASRSPRSSPAATRASGSSARRTAASARPATPAWPSPRASTSRSSTATTCCRRTPTSCCSGRWRRPDRTSRPATCTG